MAQRNYKKVLALGVICLSLVFGQTSVFAAGNMVQKAAPDQVSGAYVSYRYYVTVDGLAVRQKPSRTTALLGVLNKGDYIDVILEMGNWAFGKTSTGISGWISLYLTDIVNN